MGSLSLKKALALPVLAALVLSPIGCGEIASHAPEIATSIGLGIGGAVLIESVHDARAAGYRADQEAARLKGMTSGTNR